MEARTNSAEIRLHVYDLSRGLASGLSAGFLGIHIEGVWHTGIVVYGKEYFYGGGIQAVEPHLVAQQFQLSPTRIHNLGATLKTEDELHDFLESVSHKYTAEKYNLFNNNCNNFSDEVAKFLLEFDMGDTTAKAIPEYILNLPSQVLATPIGQTVIAPMYNQFQQNIIARGNSSGMIPFNAGQQSRFGTNSQTAGRHVDAPAGTKFEAKKIELEKRYGKEVVEFFARMGDEKSVNVSQLVEIVPRKLSICCSNKFKELVGGPGSDASDLKQFSSVLVIFNSDNVQDEADFERDRIETFDFDFFEIDEKSTDTLEKNDICLSFLEMLGEDPEAHALLVSSSGSNETLESMLLYLLDSGKAILPGKVPNPLSLQNVLTYFKKRLFTTKTTYFIDYSRMRSAIESLSARQVISPEEALVAFKMLDDLHLKSRLNVLDAALEEPIKQIMDLGLPGVDIEGAKRVLRTTNGNVEAALNLLL